MSLTTYNMGVSWFCVVGKNKFCPYHCMTVPLNIHIALEMSDELKRNKQIAEYFGTKDSAIRTMISRIKRNPSPL